MIMPDLSTLFVLSLFRGVLGLALGVAVGSGIRDLRSHKLSGLASLGSAAIFGFLVLFMYTSIPEYKENELFYWAVFAVTVGAGILKPGDTRTAVAVGALMVFSGAFLFFGIWMIASGLRLGLNILEMVIAGIFVLIGGTVPALWIISLLKGKSPIRD
jgi:hypothetical protein